MKDWVTGGGDFTKPPWNSGGGNNHYAVVRKVMRISLFIVGFAFLWIFLYNSTSPLGFPVISNYFNAVMPPSKGEYDPKLEKVLKNASMENKTVILTTLNDAWAEPGSIFDMFVESFKVGKHTEKFLKHLVVITWDEKAHARCNEVHPHCYRLETGDNFTSEAFFMTPRYLQMMWKRIDFLGTVLEMGYSFVFTDTDIMWFRDPFTRFHEDADFQIACDFFHGNSYDMKNLPNGGFNYVKSNNRTIWFYKFWYNSRTVYPKMHDQDVLNKIKWHPFISNMGLKIRFLSTAYYGGFCEPSKDFNEVCTMHANCCVGLDNKVNDLKIMLEDWKNYMALPQDKREGDNPSWRVPQSCRTSFDRAKKNQGR